MRTVPIVRSAVLSLTCAWSLHALAEQYNCWDTYCGTTSTNEPGLGCNAQGGGGGAGGGVAGIGGGGGGGCGTCGTGGGIGGGGGKGSGSGSGSGGGWAQPHDEPFYETDGPGSTGMLFAQWLKALLASGNVPDTILHGPGHRGSGCPGSECSPVGMPAWWVSEPYLSLRVEDEPLGYQPALGPRMAFHVAYRQRGTVPEEAAVFSVGANWTCSLRSWLTTNSGYAYVHRGGAGLDRYVIDTPDFREGSKVSWVEGTGWVLETRTGAKAVFALAFQVAGETRYFLSAQYDPTGNGMT